MGASRRIALLGFLPWTDPARDLVVEANPAALAAERAALLLREGGREAVFVPVEVSGEGVVRAMAAATALGAGIVIGAGQCPTECRVETVGRHPGPWAPAAPGESSPWAFAFEGDALAGVLNAHVDPEAGTGPFRASDDAGRSFCDHLCVELVRDTHRRGVRSAFLHLAAIDGLDPAIASRRVRQYAWQLVAAARWCDALPA